MIQAKEQKEAEKYSRKLERARKQEARKKIRELKARGVIARRVERLRKAELKRVLDDDIGVGHLLIPIPDPEVQAKEESTQEVTQEETIPEGFEAGDPRYHYQDSHWQRGQNEEFRREREGWLSRDFVAFEEEESSSSSSDESHDSIDLHI